MSKSISVLALSASLLASGCTTLGPDFKAPDAPTVAGYAMAGDIAPANATLSPEARVAGPWWTALGAPELDKVVRAALADSPDIAFAEANLRSALAEAGAIRGREMPALDATGGAERTRINTQSFGFTGFPSPTISLYQLGVSGNYDFDIFGKKRRASEAAAARADAEARRADAAYLTLSANVALQAVRIATLRAEIESVNRTTQGDQRVIDMISRAQQAGVTAPLFRGGELNARKKQAIADADAKYADYRRTVLRAFVQVSDAMSGITASDRSIVALDRAVAAAQANYNDSQRAYELGAGPLLNIFDAGRQLNLAQRQQISAQGQRLGDIIELFAATAADWR